MDHDAHNMAASQPTGPKNNGAHELDWVPLERDATTTSDRAPIGFHQSAVRTPRTASTTNGSNHFPKKRHPTKKQRLRFRKRLNSSQRIPLITMLETLEICSVSTQNDHSSDIEQLHREIEQSLLHHLQDLSL